MSKTKMCTCIVPLLLVPAFAFAGPERAGTTAANFLSLGSGARVLGMGGATLGLGGGLDASAWNTGALGWVDETELALSHAALSEEGAQEWVAAGGRLGALPLRWSLSGLYQTEGTFEGRDEANRSTGSFGISSMAVGAHLAGRIGRNAAIGFGAKWVNEDLELVRGSGISFDAGMLLHLGLLGFGVSAQNVGGRMIFEGRGYPFPGNLGAGLALEHPRSGLRTAFDLNVPNAYYKNMRVGAEWQWRQRVALRGGYRAELDAPSDEALSGPAFGFGAGVHGLWFDYGYLLTGNGGGQHRMGMTFSPSRVRWSGEDPLGQRRVTQDLDSATHPAPEGRRRSSRED